MPNITFRQATTLVKKHGTPLLCVSRGAVRRNYEILREALPGVEFYYAAKSNPDVTILKVLKKAGCKIDVCSVGETIAALEAGFTPEEMLHTHPCKTMHNLTWCYEQGLRNFVYDNRTELQKIKDHAPEASLLLRVAMSSYSSLINLSAKFGCAPSEALGLLKDAQALGVKVDGIAFHVGSQTIDPGDYAIAFAQVRKIYEEAARNGIVLKVIDIGGGMPAPYREAVMGLGSFCQNLNEALTEHFGDLPVKIIAEPGRALSADTTTLVTSVIGKSVRPNGKTQYIIDDGLYGSFSGKVFDHVDYPLIAEKAKSRPNFECIVAGPTCDSTDLVATEQPLPDLALGEVLLVPSMGAYTNASASTFNGLEIARRVEVS